MNLRALVLAATFALAASGVVDLASAQVNEGTVTAAQTSSPEASADETAGLSCINDNRAAVQLPPLSLQEFREGRAAGMIADPSTLCGEDHIAPAASEQTLIDRASPAVESTRPNNDQANAIVIAFLIVCALAYFAPTAIAFRRGHQYRWIIAAFNVVTAWTGIAWIWLLAWAAWPRNRALASPVLDDATGINQSGR